MGRHSAPDDDGDVLVEEAPPARPRPRPRHAAPDDTEAHRASAALTSADTDVIDPELVERAADEAPRNVVDAVVVEDEVYSVRARSRPGEPVAELPARPAPAPVPAPADRPSPEPGPPKRERAGRADLRLLRQNSSLRARCLAAVLLPFVLYTIALVVIDRVDVYLFWIWIPAILAGVLFGAQLDAAHRGDARRD